MSQPNMKPEESEIIFIKEIGLHWPAWDTKTNQNYTYILKHLADMDDAIERCKEKKVCLQAGGHVGLWAIRLSQHFEKVITFEAEPSVATCLIKNTLSFPNISPEWGALSDDFRTLKIKRSGSSGSNRINPAEGIEIKAIPIDSLNLKQCDAIFLDVEHHEIQVLKGAINTLHEYSPILHIEELDKDDGVADFLSKLGYKRVSKQDKDVVYAK